MKSCDQVSSKIVGLLIAISFSTALWANVINGSIVDLDKTDPLDTLQKEMDAMGLNPFGANELNDPFPNPVGLFESLFQDLNRNIEKNAIESETMTEARRLIDEGEFEQAIEELDKLTQLFPTANYPNIVKALLLANLGDRQEATRILESIVAMDTRNIPALAYLIDLYIVADNVSAARQTIGRLYEIDPNVPQIHFGLGMIADKQGDVVSAIQFYERGLGLAPGYALGKINVSRLYNVTKQYSRTVELLGQSELGNIGSLSGFRFLGIAYLGLGQDENALSTFVDAKEAFPAANLSLELGVTHSQLENYEDSLVHLEKAIEANPGSIVGYVEKAKVLAQMERYQDAILVLKGSKSLDLSDSVESDILMADYYERSGKTQEAKDIIQGIMNRNDLTLSILSSLSNFFVLKGRNDDAAELWKIGQEKFPKSPVPSFRLGHVLKSAGKFKESISAFSEASRFAPDDLNFKLEIVFSYRDSGELDSAINYLEKLLASYPERVDLMHIAGNFFYEEGEFQRGIDTYRKISRLDDRNVAAINNIANGYHEIGDLENAERWGRRALNLDPENPAIQDTLGWILLSKNKLEEGRMLLEKAYHGSKRDFSTGYHLAKAYQLSGELKKANDLLISIFEEKREFPEQESAMSLLGELANQ